MIIMLRGNNGSGKSTVVRNVVQQMHSTPLYGARGPKIPEAYCCLHKTSPKHVGGPPTFVLGPYESPQTTGFDCVIRLGMEAALALLEKYRVKATPFHAFHGGHVLFESVFTSVRFLEPSIGKWLTTHKGDAIIATLDTTLEQCLSAIEERKKTSLAGTKWSSKYLEGNHKQFERVTAQYEELGFRMEYVSRENASEKILGWLKEKPRHAR